MIIGHGIDIVDLKRFRLMNQYRLEKIANRICTDTELNNFQQSKIQYQYLAKIWAGKEAISKTFGTGIRGVVVWKNIIISSNKLNKPVVNFTEELAGPWPKPICHLSFSHDKELLIASAILEKL